jgi:hypothetical protein
MNTLRSLAARIFGGLAWRFALLALGAAALFMALTAVPGRSDSGARVAGPAGAPAAGPGSDTAAPAGPASYAAIAEHPLFYPSRTPWAPPPPPPPKPVSTAPSPLTNYALIGVIVSGETRTALIRPPGANKTITIAEGQNLGGWTLQEITRTRLRFAAGDASYEMNFPKPSESRR